MALILKQDDPNAVPTPVSGKGTIFLNENDDLSVKKSDGNIEVVSFVTGNNTEVFFNDNQTLGTNANLTFNKSTSVLTVTGNVSANYFIGNGSQLTGIATPASLANGTSNVSIPVASGNINASVNGNANILVVTGTGVNVAGTLNATGNASVGNIGATTAVVTTGNITTINSGLMQNGNSNVTITANANVTINANGGARITATNVGANITGTLGVSGNANTGNLGTGRVIATGNISGTQLISNIAQGTAPLVVTSTTQVANLNVATAGTAGTVTTNAQPNITSVGTLENLSVTGNAIIGGNLTVNGNVTYVNVDTLQVEDPLIALGGGPNGAALTSNDGKDRGLLLHYYTSAPVDAFMGWDNGNSEFTLGSNVSVTNDVVTYNTLGNVRAAAAKLTSAQVGATASTTDFPNAIAITSQADTGYTTAERVGLVGEVLGDSANTSTSGIGVLGVGKVSGDTKATGVQGVATVNNTADVGAAVGIRGYATSTHAGGFNIGVLGNAQGSGVGNYAFYVQNGGIASIENVTFWDLFDNSNVAITFNSTGKANILRVDTTDSAEGVGMSGYLSVTGNANIGNIGTGGLITATGNITGGNLSTGGTLSVTGNANVGNLGTARVIATGNISGTQLISNIATGTAPLVVTSTTQVANLNVATAGTATTAGTVTTNAQPNITSVGTLSSLSVTGNTSSGNFVGVLANGNSNVNIPAANGNVNISAAGNANIVVVTGIGVNVAGRLNATGNITAPYFIGNVEGNISGNIVVPGTNTSILFNNDGNAGSSANLTFDKDTNILTVTGATSVTGNVTAGNVYANSGTVGASLLTGTLTTAAQPNITSVGTLSSLSVTGNTSSGNFIGAFANGNSSITIPAANGNIVLNAANGTSELTITSTGVNVSGTLNATGNANTGNLGTGTAIITTGNITTINSGLMQNGNSNIAITANSNVTISAVGGARITATSTGANVTGTLGVSGNANTGNLGTATAIITTGNITTINSGLMQNGNSNVTITANGNVTIAAVGGNRIIATSAGANVTGTLGVSGNANVGNIGATNANVTAITATANANVGNLGTGGLIVATGNITGGNLITGGVLTVNGTGTSTIAGNLDMTSNTIINLATPTNPTDAATKGYVDSVAEGLHIQASCNAATDGTLATISGGTVTYNNGSSGVGATLTTTGSYTTIDGVTLVNGMRILVKNEATKAHNGIYVRTSATVLTRATDYDAAAEIQGGDFTFVTAGTLYNSTGWVQIDPVTTVGTDPIEWEQFSGAGTYLAGTGLTLTGTTFSVNASQTQITSVGTLTGLNVNGNIVAANISANTGIFSGNGSGLTNLAGANVTGQVGNALVAGTVYTAAQPNITSVGTLSSLAVTANVTAGNVYANSGTIGASLLTGTLTTAAQPNITSVGTLTTATITTGNITTINSGLLQNGNSNVTITANGNVTLNAVGGARIIATSTGANVTGTLGVSGNANVGNLGTARVIATGNISGTQLISNIATGTAPLVVTSTTQVANLNAATAGTATSATTAGTVTTAAQPNITSVGTLTGLTVNGTSNLGAVGNVKITGGSSNQILQTDGTGNLSWANSTGGYYLHTQGSASTTWTIVHNLNNQYVSVDPIDNTGNSYIGRYNYPTVNYTNANAVTLTFSSAVTGYCAIVAGGFTYVNGSSSTAGGLDTYVQFNDGGTLSGQSSFTFNKTTGTVSATLVSGTLTTAAQPNITSVGTLTTATITTGNITTINSGLLQNGNSNVTITANGNVTLNAVGGARIIATSTGANVTGTLGVSGNANTGNLGTATAIITTGNITTINSGLMQNGNSNVTITANANVTINANGGARITATNVGANITGTLGVSGNANVGNLTCSGTVTAQTLTETSSVVYKENINPITNALDTIQQLVGVTYDRKDGTKKNEAGLVAEDVEKILPNLIGYDEHGKPVGIHYTKLTAYLIEAVKELTDKIKRLENK